MARSLLIILVLGLSSLSIFSQEISGISIGYGFATPESGGLDLWVQDHNDNIEVTSKLTAPSATKGLTFGFVHHAKRWEYGFRFLCRLATQKVIQKDVSGNLVSYNYKFRQNLYQLMELVGYPGNKFFGIGTSFDIGTFKISTKVTEEPITSYKKVVADRIFGQQLMAKIRVPANKFAFSVTGYYQLNYNSATIDLPVSEGSIDYSPSGPGIRMEVVIGVK